MDSVLNDSDEIIQDNYDNQQDDEGNRIVYDQNISEENEVLNDGTSGMEQNEEFVEEDIEAGEEQISFEQPTDYHEEHSEEVGENTTVIQKDNEEEDVYQNDVEQQNDEIVYEDQEGEINYVEDEHYPEQTPEDENFVAYKEEEYGGIAEEVQEENMVDNDGDIDDKDELGTENFHDASFEEVQYGNAEEEVIEDEHEATYEPDDNAEQHETIDNEDIDDTENIHYDQGEPYPAVGDTSQEIVAPDDAADENLHSEGSKSPADDDDYEDVVEVEEDQQNEEGEDENVAQHESGSDNEIDEEAVEEDTKLDHMSDYDVRDSDEEDDELFKNEDDKPSDEVAAKILDSDSDEDKEKEGVGDLIADIFGKSDDEDEEFTGFGEEESSALKKNKSLGAVISSSDDDEEEEEGEVSTKKQTSRQEDSSSDEGVRDGDKGSGGMVYDFDVMLQRKKDERKGRRRKDGGTFISDADDIINAMLTKMREAAVADREANQLKKPALSKLKMLPTVVRHLKKQDLKEAFVDMGMIAAIADWLTLLPDRSLPHISIRAELLAVLHDLPTVSPETLKSSGIGRAVMVLFKHPRETRKHKESAGRLINKWSRPIFGLNENFKSMSRGEREQRDLDQMPQSKRRKLSSGRSDAEKAGEPAPEPGQLRPGERGFVMRARVPMPSNKDYVIRPKWNVGEEDEERPTGFNKRGKQKKDERLEKHIKTFADRRKNLKMQRAVGISIEGNKMPLT